MSKQLETAIYFSIFLHMTRKIFNKMCRPRHLFRTRQYKPRGIVWIPMMNNGVWVFQDEQDMKKEGIRRAEQFESSPDLEYCLGDMSKNAPPSSIIKKAYPYCASLH